MTRHFILSSLSFLLIIFAFCFWNRLTASSQPHDTLKAVSALPDAWMEGIEAKILNKQGKMSMSIETPKMTHYAEQDVSVFDTPHLIFYQTGRSPWNISAKHATALKGMDTVHFQEEVIAKQAANLKYPATLIKTLSLTVHPHLQTAETKDEISMHQANIILKAQGLHADMNTGNIRLLSNVRGEYVSD